MSSSDRRELASAPEVLADRWAARIALALALVLAGLALPRLLENGEQSGRVFGTYSQLWVVLLSVSFLIALATLLVWAAALLPGARPANTVQLLLRRLERLGAANLLLFGLPWVVYAVAILWRLDRMFVQYSPRAWIFWLACLLGALPLLAWQRRLGYFWALVVTTIVYGVGIKLLGFLPEISAYPFSLGWSEASRFYYASLPFAERLYGQSIELSPLHPSRYLVLGLPFLFERSSIWLLRFWQVALWVVLTLATSLAFVWRFYWRRASNRSWLVGLVLTGWAFLFLLQGPVYYHLHLCLLPVLLWFDRRSVARSLIVVVLASLWAGISRVNWFPVPGLLASLLYFVEQPLSHITNLPGVRGWLRYLLPPLAWTVGGLAAALLAQAAYIPLSGHGDASAFESTFTSALLWYRLLPSATYPLGVIPAMLLISTPLLLLLIVNALRDRALWHPLRLLGLAAILLVFLLGGLVVSTKIGGGGNAHNLDAFLVLLLAAGMAVWFGAFQPEQGAAPAPWRPWLVVLLVALAPVFWNLNIGDPFVRRDFAQAEVDLQKLRGFVEQYGQQGEVLFITQRQLLVFDILPDAALTADYELLMLSEMAISNNLPYLARFEHDLASHRFALIISDRSLTMRDPALHNFAEENNAWVKHIGLKLDRYYDSLLYFDTQGIDVLIPRTDAQ